MNSRAVFLIWTLVLSLFATGLLAGETQEWVAVNDPDEMRQLLSGSSLDGTDFTDFYRSDGVMGYHNKNSDTTVVRKWTVQTDGEICMYIYVKPDKLIGCSRLDRSATDPELFRITNLGRGYSMQGRLTNVVPQTLVDIVNQTAKPEK